MPELDTISHVLEKLYRKGYTEDFKASRRRFALMPANILVDPEHIIVDEIHRFEGETNLDDEAVIFLLAARVTSARALI